MLDDKDPEKWKFDRRVSIADLVTIVGTFSAMLFAYTTLDKRLALVEQQHIQVMQMVRDAREDRHEQLEKLFNRIDKIGDDLNTHARGESQQRGR